MQIKEKMQYTIETWKRTHGLVPSGSGCRSVMEYKTFGLHSCRERFSLCVIYYNSPPFNQLTASLQTHGASIQ